ncbi:hypothetical protein Q3G72_005896 [Acer saccharum]|nr:hypothetical protein Q3G72_005896 [Acer saccharum]
MFLTDQDAFPNLKKLYLFELSQLSHLWKENSQNSSIFEKLTKKEDGTCQEVDLNSTIQERIAATKARKEKERKRNQRKAKWSYLRVPKVLRKISGHPSNTSWNKSS